MTHLGPSSKFPKLLVFFAKDSLAKEIGPLGASKTGATTH